jgi:DNA-binding IclR family transcriptional regulator
MSHESTSRKMLRILDLLEESEEPVTAERMLHELGYTRSVLYRHLKILTESNLIASISDAGYTLGPRIVELDYKIRSRDPLLAAARPSMVELAERERGIALLCRRYNGLVLCIHQERGDPTFRSNFTRGLARPLFRGAASRIILAHMKPAAVSRLLADHQEAFSEGELGANQADAVATLRRLRKRGWDITAGQVTAGVIGIAAPVFDRRGEILGSLSLTLRNRERNEKEIQRLIERVRMCAAITTNAVAQRN